MKVVFTLMFLVLLASCRSIQPVTITERVTETVTETIRDTTILVQPDAATIRALLECDENRNVIIKKLIDYEAGKHVRPPKISIADNILTATAEVDSFAIYLTWKQREVQSQSTKTIYETKYIKMRGAFWWIGVVFSIMATTMVIVTVVYIIKVK